MGGVTRAGAVPCAAMRRLALALVVTAALAACKKDSENPAGKATEAAASKVTVTVDGKDEVIVDRGRASAFAPLGHFLPQGAKNIESWGSIEVTLASGEQQTIAEPAKKYPGLVAAIVPGSGGIALGFFAPEDLAKKGKAQWQVGPLTAVTVKTAAPGGQGGQGGGDGAGGGGENEGERPKPTADLTFLVGDRTFTGEQLAALPTSTAPVGDTDTPGWTLPQVLEAAGVKPTGKIILHGEESANLILEPGDLDPATTVAFIKLNRSGQLRFRLFKKKGETWDIVGELRGIAKIELK